MICRFSRGLTLASRSNSNDQQYTFFTNRRLIYDSWHVTAFLDYSHSAYLFGYAQIHHSAKRLRWIDSGFDTAGFGWIHLVDLQPTALILVSH